MTLRLCWSLLQVSVLLSQLVQTVVIVFHRQWLDLRGSQDPTDSAGQSHLSFKTQACKYSQLCPFYCSWHLTICLYTIIICNSVCFSCFPLRHGPAPAEMPHPLVAMVVRPSSVSAQGVSAAASLAAAASRQLLRELQATAAHVWPGDPCCARHAEEDPQAERERGYTDTHTHTQLSGIRTCFSLIFTLLPPKTLLKLTETPVS